MTTTLSESNKSQPRIVAAPPEYGDSHDVQRYFGLKETMLYHLWRSGKIKAILVKGTGKSRGKRLYNFQAIRELLKNAEEKGDWESQPRGERFGKPRKSPAKVAAPEETPEPDRPFLTLKS